MIPFHMITHCFQGDHRPSRLDHGIFLVVLNKICQSIEVFPATNLILVFLQTKCVKADQCRYLHLDTTISYPTLETHMAWNL